MTSTVGRQLRLLLVTPRYFPFTGGTETHVYEIARRLAQTDVDVTVLTTDPGGRLRAEEVIDRVRIVRARAWPDVEDFYFAPGVYRHVRAGAWEVLHVQGSHTFVPPLAIIAARQAGLPYVITFHTSGLPPSSRLRKAGRGLQWSLLRGLFAGADRLIAVSRQEERFFRDHVRLPADRFAYIPNGSDLPRPSVTADAKGGTRIVSVGRLERYKGHQRVIAALPKLLEHRSDSRLRILGSGPYEHDLIQLANDLGVEQRVEIQKIPAEDRRGMANALAEADLVVLMSDGESNPVAVMEALGLHRPVLAAHTPGLIELADRGLIRTVPLNSPPETVAAAMMRQLDDPLVPNLVELPTWDECANALRQVYEDVTRRTARVS